MAALQKAQRELDRLRLALAFAERQEAEQAAAAAEAIAQAERQKARDKLVRERDRLRSLAEAEHAKSEAAEAKLPSAAANLDELARQWQNQKVAIDMLTDQRDNAAGHAAEFQAQVNALEQQIAASPVTAAEMAAAAEQAEQAAAAQAAANLAVFEADTARRLQEAIDAQIIDAPEAFEPEPSLFGGIRAGRWHKAPKGKTIRIARKDLPAHQARMAAAAAWYAEHAEPFEIVVAADRRYYAAPDGQITVITGNVHLQRRLLPEFHAEQKRLAKAFRKATKLRAVSPSDWYEELPA